MAGQTLQPEFARSVHEALRKVSPRVDLGPIAAEDRLADLGLDSISLSELFIVLEDQLGLTIDEQQLVGVQTFGDLQDLVTRIKAGLPSPPEEPV